MRLKSEKRPIGGGFAGPVPRKSDQLRRAVVSIPSNIAEGNGRSGNKDYAHFLAVARGSLYETVTQLEIARDLGYIDSIDTVIPLAEEVSRMLTTMLKRYGALEQKTAHHCPPPPSLST